MLLPLISIGWLSLVGLVLSACRVAAGGEGVAARGEALPATPPAPAEGGESPARTRTPWRELPPFGASTGRTSAEQTGPSLAGGVSRVRGVRGRGGRCAAGS
jgi:hypothetical protein